MIHSCFVMQDFEPVGEDGGSRRRADMALRFNGWVYLFEFKVVERGPEGTALGQPRRKGYADKYRDPGLPVHLIGAEFSREDRRDIRPNCPPQPRHLRARAAPSARVTFAGCRCRARECVPRDRSRAAAGESF